jgi:hypothetical protein
MILKRLISGLLILSVFLAGACSEPKEKQTIVDYLNGMTSVWETYLVWHDEWNAFTKTRFANAEEAITKLRDLDLVRKMEKIYMDVEKSAPPKELYEFKGKWSRLCQLNLQSLALTIQFFDTKDTSLGYKINELTFEANTLTDEFWQELLKIFNKYNIEYQESG